MKTTTYSMEKQLEGTSERNAGNTKTDTRPDRTPRRRFGAYVPRWLAVLWSRVVSWVIRNLVEGIVLHRAGERFYMVFGGHIFFQTLSAAVELDLFTILRDQPGLTAESIAARLGLAAQPTRILLLGLTSVKFLKKKGHLYHNTYLTNELLTRQSPRNVIAYVRLQSRGMYKAMPHLLDSLRANKNLGLEEFAGSEPTFYQRLAYDSGLEQVFQDAMQQLSVQTNELFGTFVDLSGIRHVVDVGGGDGTNAIELVRQYPGLKATVFDLPAVCAIARKNIEAHGLSGRIHVVEGNCFEDEFPRGADGFLFSHFFTIWSKEKDLRLLKKAHDALPRGGRVMIFNMMQKDDGTGPLSAAVGSPYFHALATGEGMLYSWSEYESLFQQAGLVGVRRVCLPRDHGVIWGVKK